MTTWFVYLVRCVDGSLYAGVTTELARRLAQHNGRHPGGSAYCRSRRPVTLAWSCAVRSRAAALRREHAIKQLSRLEKERLVNGKRGHAGKVRRPAAARSRRDGST